MKEALGGVLSFQAIFVFLVLMIGLLMFSVSYTKSFHMKNQLITIIEQYEGLTPSASDKIDDYANRLNYSFSSTSIYEDKCRRMGYEPYVQTLDSGEKFVFCVKCELADVTGTNNSNLTYKGAQYAVATFVNVNIPIINRIFPAAANFLVITGETDTIYSSGNNSELCRNARHS